MLDEVLDRGSASLDYVLRFTRQYSIHAALLGTTRHYSGRGRRTLGGNERGTGCGGAHVDACRHCGGCGVGGCASDYSGSAVDVVPVPGAHRDPLPCLRKHHGRGTSRSSRHHRSDAGKSIHAVGRGGIHRCTGTRDRAVVTEPRKIHGEPHSGARCGIMCRHCVAVGDLATHSVQRHLISSAPR